MKKPAIIIGIILVISLIGGSISSRVNGDFEKFRNGEVYYSDKEFVNEKGFRMGPIVVNHNGFKFGPINIGPRGINIRGGSLVGEDYLDMDYDDYDRKDYDMVFGSNKEFTKDISRIKVESISSNVVISLGDVTRVSYLGEGDSNRHSLLAKLEDDKLVVREKISSQMGYNGMTRSTVEIQLDKDSFSSIYLSTVSGNIELKEDLNAKDMEVETISGNIIGEKLTSDDLDISTTSGNIKLADLSGSIEVDTISGNTSLVFTSGNLSIDSISGDISLEVSQAKDMYNYRVDTVSGNIDIFGDRFKREVDLNSSAKNKIEVDTVSGDFKVQ